MSIGTIPTRSDWQPPRYPVRRFTVNEYHQMIQMGLLTEDDAVELLEGFIVPKMPRKPSHDIAIELMQRKFGSCLPAGWRLRVQCAITITDSEPEPDVTLARGDPRDDLSQHPGPKVIGLLVEVADSSLSRDRFEKGQLYAWESIPIYWVVNLIDARIEVYSAPSGPDPNPGYRHRQDYGMADAVPLVLDGQVIATIPVRDLLP